MSGMEKVILEVSPEVAKALKSKGYLEAALREASGCFSAFERCIFKGTVGEHPMVSRAAEKQILTIVEDLFAGDTDKAKMDGVRLAVHLAVNADPQKLNELVKQGGEMLGKLFGVFGGVAGSGATAGAAAATSGAMMAMPWVAAGLAAVEIGVTVAGFAAMEERMTGIQNRIEKLDSEVRQMNELQKASTYTRLSIEYVCIAESVFDRAKRGRMVEEKELEDLMAKLYAMPASLESLGEKYEMLRIRVTYELLPILVQALLLWLDRFYYDNDCREPFMFKKCLESLGKLQNDDSIDRITDFYLLRGEHLSAMKENVAVARLVPMLLQTKLEDRLAITKGCGTPEVYASYRESLRRVTEEGAEQLRPILEATRTREETSAILREAVAQATA